MLTLTIKKKWFDLILSGEKKEEYREIKPYYTKRFCNAIFSPFKIPECDYPLVEEKLREHWSDANFEVMFRNGYSANSPSFIAKVFLSIGTGKEEWGAEQGKEYYVLRILEVRDERGAV